MWWISPQTVNDMLRGTVKKRRRFQEHCLIVPVNWPFKTLHKKQANLKGSYALLKYGTLEILVCKYGCYTQLSQAEFGKSGSLCPVFPSVYSFFVSRLAVPAHELDVLVIPVRLDILLAF